MEITKKGAMKSIFLALVMSLPLSAYAMSSAEAEAQFNFQNYVIQGLIGALVMGIVTTAIAMIFIRTKKRNL